MVGGPRQLVSPNEIQEELERIVREVTERSELQRVVVARADGLVITHNLSDPARAKQLAAMAAAVVGVASMASSALVEGRFREANIDAERTQIAFLPAGDQAVAAGLFSEDANFEGVLRRLRHLADQVADLVDQGPSRGSTATSTRTDTGLSPSRAVPGQ